MSQFRKEELIFGELARFALSALALEVGDERMVRHSATIIYEFRKLAGDLTVALAGDEIAVSGAYIDNPSCIEAAFAQKLRECGWEELKLSRDITREGLTEMAMALARAAKPPMHGRGWTAEHITFDILAEKALPREGAAYHYVFLLNQAREAIYSAVGGEGGAIRIALNVARGIGELVVKHAEAPLLVRRMLHFDEFTYTHGLNVALITYAAGAAMGIEEQRLIEITMGALCHDVGKEKIPQDLLKKPGGYTEGEMQLMRRHPIDGARMLTALKTEVPPLMPVIAIEHHMRQVHGGYPEPLPGHSTHPASGLVAVADVYEALRTNHAYRAAKTPQGAFTELLAEGRLGRLDKRLLPAFAGILGIVEVGAKVRLGDGRDAEVTRKNEANPLKPTVRAGVETFELAAQPGFGISGVYDPPEED